GRVGAHQGGQITGLLGGEPFGARHGRLAQLGLGEPGVEYGAVGGYGREADAEGAGHGGIDSSHMPQNTVTYLVRWPPGRRRASARAASGRSPAPPGRIPPHNRAPLRSADSARRSW